MKAVIFSKNKMKAQRIEGQIKAAGLKDQIETILSFEGLFRDVEKNPVDVVFLDVDDEDTDWESACKMIKFADSNIWVVLLSENTRAAAKAFELGASDYFVKPLGKTQLERTLSKLESTSGAQ